MRAAILESLASDWLIGRELGHVTPSPDRKTPSPDRKPPTGSPITDLLKPEVLVNARKPVYTTPGEM